MFRIAAIVVIALLTSSTARLPMPAVPPDDFKIKDCDSAATSDIREAHQFVASRLGRVFDPMTFLTSKQRSEMKEKWPKLTADCIDDKNKCVKDPFLGGRAHGGLGNQVNLCYYNLVDLNLKICDLVDTMVHEEAHANGFPKMNGHNDPTSAIRAKDVVYRTGTTAGNFCRAEAAAGRFNDHNLIGISQRAIGANCSKDDQCKTGKCQKDKCVCKEDIDCKSRKCKKPLFGSNYCEP